MNENLKREIININGKEINVFIDYENSDAYISRNEIAHLYDEKPNNISVIIRRIIESTGDNLSLVHSTNRNVEN